MWYFEIEERIGRSPKKLKYEKNSSIFYYLTCDQFESYNQNALGPISSFNYYFFFLSQINASPCQSVYLEKKTDKRLLFTHYHYQSVQCVAFFKAGMEPHHAIFLQQFETSNRVFIRHNNLSFYLCLGPGKLSNSNENI